MRWRPLALMYHGFSDGPRADDPYDLFVDVADFAAQLRWLLDRGWRPLTVAEYAAAVRRRRPVDRSFLVTIDDGFPSVGDLAVPVLERFGVPAVLYVPPAAVGATTSWNPLQSEEPLMTWAQVRALPDLVELGVHGADHTRMVGMSRAELIGHVDDARTALESGSGRTAGTFAYPYGDFDESARAAVERAGFDVAFAVRRDAGTYALSRVDVGPRDTLSSLRVKTIPGYRKWWRAASAVAPVRRLVRRIVQR